MKYYARQIRPYIRPHQTPGSLCVSWPVDGYDWVPEDMEEELRAKIGNIDGLFELTFKERFVEVRND